MLGALGRWLAKRIHPWAGALVAYGDGELGPLATRWVEHHIQTCSSCRREMQLFKEQLGRFQLFAQPSPDPEMLEQGLADLRQAMRRFVPDAHQPQVEDQDLAARRRFVQELEGYLGKRAAGALVGRLGQDKRLHDLLFISAPALTALLGRKTTDAIVARILRTEGFDSGAA